MVEFLIKNGANMNATNNDGADSLIRAIKSSELIIFDLNSN